MADVSRTVEIAIRGVDNISKTMSGISSNLDSFGGTVTAVTGPLADFSKQLILVEAALGALAVGGLALAFMKSTEFETASVSLSKILGDQKGIIGAVEDEMLDLSIIYGQSAADLLNSTTDFKKAGFDLEESMGLVENAINLVAAGAEPLLDMSLATELIIATLKGFKAPASEAGRLTDILNTVANEYATSVTELATGMSKLSPIAAKMGFSFEETAGILTPVIEIFRSGDEAAVSLRTGLLKLIADQPKVQGALEALGVTQRDVNGALRSGRDILFDVAEAFQTADENDKLFLATQLVGFRQAAKMVEVFDGLALSLEIAAAGYRSTGSATLETAIRLETAQIAIDRFIVGLENIGIAVGDQFRLAAKEAIDGATTIETVLAELIDKGALDPVLDEVVDFAAKLSVYLQDVAKVMPDAFANLDWDPLTDSFDDLGETIQKLFNAFFGEIDLTTAEGLTSGLQKMIDAFATLNTTVAGVLTGWTPFVELLGNLVDEVLESEEASKRFIGEILGWAGVIDKVVGSLGFLTAALNVLIGAKAVTSVISMGKSIGSLGTVAATVTTTLGVLGGAIAVFAAGYALAEWAYKNNQAFKDLIDTFNQSLLWLSGLDDASIKHIEYMANETKVAGDLAVAMVRLAEEYEDMPDAVETKILVAGTEEYKSALDEILSQIESVPESKFVELKGDIVWGGDLAAGAAGSDDLKQIIFSSDPSEKEITIFTDVDTGALTLVQNKIEEALPGKKEVEIELTGADLAKVRIAEIDAAADTVQNSLEWKAKVDIAEFEANADIMVALAQTIEGSFANTGELILGLFSALEGASGFTQFLIEDQIKLENERRSELLAMEKELTAAQIDYLRSRTAALEKGEGLISISMEGIYPELELIMWEIVRRIQIQSNTEGMEFLLGL